jgi:hypothetical protein
MCAMGLQQSSRQLFVGKVERGLLFWLGTSCLCCTVWLLGAGAVHGALAQYMFCVAFLVGESGVVFAGKNQARPWRRLCGCLRACMR